MFLQKMRVRTGATYIQSYTCIVVCKQGPTYPTLNTNYDPLTQIFQQATFSLANYKYTSFHTPARIITKNWP